MGRPDSNRMARETYDDITEDFYVLTEPLVDLVDEGLCGQRQTVCKLGERGRPLERLVRRVVGLVRVHDPRERMVVKVLWAACEVRRPGVGR